MTTSENAALIEAVQQQRAEIVDRNATGDVLLIATHGEVVPLDLARFGKHPRRTIRATDLHTLDAFARYVSVNDEAAASIYADITQSRFVAVIDDDTVEHPGWRAHRATLDLRQHPMFKHWLSKSGSFLPQAQFLEHIDYGRSCVVDPDQATLREVVSHLRGSKNTTWESGTVARDGTVQLAYVETAAAQAKRGDAELPATIRLRLRPYLADETTIDIVADLRYRIEEGALHLGYVLLEVDIALEELFGRLTQLIEAATGKHVLAGTAPTPAG
jgi:uncharacterized protein YfdQ (DUF2303 family)